MKITPNYNGNKYVTMGMGTMGTNMSQKHQNKAFPVKILKKIKYQVSPPRIIVLQQPLLVNNVMDI